MKREAGGKSPTAATTVIADKKRRNHCLWREGVLRMKQKSGDLPL